MHRNLGPPQNMEEIKTFPCKQWLILLFKGAAVRMVAHSVDASTLEGEEGRLGISGQHELQSKKTCLK